MSDRYRIANSDNRGEHARLTRPILVLITVLIQSVIAARVSRDDKLPDNHSGFPTFFPTPSPSSFPFLLFFLFYSPPSFLFATGQTTRHFQRDARVLSCNLQFYTNLLTETTNGDNYSKASLFYVFNKNDLLGETRRRWITQRIATP